MVDSELDLVSAVRLEPQVLAAAGSSPQLIVLDMRRVEFMDCSGVAAIMRVQLWLLDREIMLTLEAVGPQPRRLLALAGVDVAILPASDDRLGVTDASPVTR